VRTRDNRASNLVEVDEFLDQCGTLSIEPIDICGVESACLVERDFGRGHALV
jgi:hypothetical protein